jgi:hypothetical protein
MLIVAIPEFTVTVEIPLPRKSNTVAPVPTTPPTVLIPTPAIDVCQSVFPWSSTSCSTFPGVPRLVGSVIVYPVPTVFGDLISTYPVSLPS